MTILVCNDVPDAMFVKAHAASNWNESTVMVIKIIQGSLKCEKNLLFTCPYMIK